MKALQVIAIVIVALGLVILPAKSGPALAGKEFNMSTSDGVDYFLEFNAFGVFVQGRQKGLGYLIDLETPLGTS